MIKLNSNERIAGAATHNTRIPIHIIGECSIVEMIPMGPTIPHVPIPAETPVHSNSNTSVEIGPHTAAANVGAIHI